MSTRAEFAQTEILNYFRQWQKMPAEIQMHPVFERALRSESPWAFGMHNFCDGANTFAGIPVAISVEVHACRCAGESP